jgi:hypothetical protein
LPEQAQRLITAGCLISGRTISDRPGYPSITKRPTPYRLVAFSPVEVDMASLRSEPEVPTATMFVIPPDVSNIGDEDEQWASTELIIPADPTIFTTATAAGCTTSPTPDTTSDGTCRTESGSHGVALWRTELLHTHASSFVSPRPASTQTASRVTLRATASSRRINRSGSWNQT